MSDQENTFLKALKLILLIILTGGIILLVWSVRQYREQRGGSTVTPTVKETNPKRFSKIKVAFGVAVIGALMYGIYLMELDQYFMTSILNISQKQAIQASAQARIGLPYEYGSTGPNSFDCSGFSGAVLQEALGLTDIPRRSADMYTMGRDIAFEQVGVGDLLFFDTTGDGNISHVGIVTKKQGDKVFMTHANSYYGKVMEEEIKGYWLETYYGARELTNVTASLVASSEPDETYDPPAEIVEDQYDGDFPVSEPPAEEEENTEDDLIDDDLTDDDTLVDDPTSDEVVDSGFSDVPATHENYRAITYLKENGIIGGFGDGTFKPDQTVTRAETLKIALNGADVATDAYRTQSPAFSDVSAGHSLLQYINYAQANDVVGGYPDGTYQPDNTITRGEASKILLNINGVNPPEPARAPYSDVPLSLDLAKYIAYVDDKNLLDVAGGVFGINTPMTRGDVAEMMYRLIAINQTNASQYTDLLTI